MQLDHRLTTETPEQTAIKVAGHEKTSLFLLIFSIAIYVRDAGVAGSNPATPTKIIPGAFAFFPSAFKVNQRAVSMRRNTRFSRRARNGSDKAHFAGPASGPRRSTGQTGDCRPANGRPKKTRPKVLRSGSWSLLQARISPRERPIPDMYGPLSKVV